jgi:hypothetical protein
LQRLKNKHVERALKKLDAIEIRLTSWSHNVDTLHH